MTNISLAIIVPQILELYVKLDPEDPEGFCNLGCVFDKLGDHERESRAYEKALEIDPNCWLAHLNLATCQLQAGQKHAAADRLQKLATEGQAPYNQAARQILSSMG